LERGDERGKVMTKIKPVIALIIVLGFIFIPYVSYSRTHERDIPKLIIFHSSGCHNCIRAEKEIIPALEERFKDKVEIEYRNVDDVENYKLLLSLKEKHHSKIRDILPVFYYEGRFLNGQGDIKKNLEALLIVPAARVDNGPQTLPKIDLARYFDDFSILAVMAAGLIDGINPCAFTVIVFFMSFLAFQGYGKREMAMIGLIFIISVYLTYCLIGLGIFESLYNLRGFWLLTKAINITVGVIGVIFGACALYDFIKYKRTKSTDGLLLSLPQSIKNKIHSVIGLHYRVHAGGDDTSLKKPLMVLAVSALVTGFLVSVLEAVCTAQIYLPTIVFILRTTGPKLKALGYLLLYNLLFVVPLLVIFSFALAGTTSEHFQKVLRKHLGAIKILMGMMFLGLGIFLIWRA